MTHERRLIAATGVWTGGVFDASRRLSCRRGCRRTTAHWRGLGRALMHSPAPRNRAPQLAILLEFWRTSANLSRDVCADIARAALGDVERHHAQGMPILTG